jgi:Leucine-rich repeat (LRR) protein
MERLTAAVVSGLHPGKDVREIEAVVLSDQGILEVDDLTVCEKLKRLDLKGNQISSVEGISQLRNLSWLSLAHNKLTSMRGMAGP